VSMNAYVYGRADAGNDKGEDRAGEKGRRAGGRGDDSDDELFKPVGAKGRRGRGLDSEEGAGAEEELDEADDDDAEDISRVSGFTLNSAFPT